MWAASFVLASKSSQVSGCGNTFTTCIFLFCFLFHSSHKKPAAHVHWLKISQTQWNVHFCPPSLLTWKTSDIKNLCHDFMTSPWPMIQPITCQQICKPLWFNQSPVGKYANHCDLTNHLSANPSGSTNHLRQTTCKIKTCSFSLLAKLTPC